MLSCEWVRVALLFLTKMHWDIMDNIIMPCIYGHSNVIFIKEIFLRRKKSTTMEVCKNMYDNFKCFYFFGS